MKDPLKKVPFVTNRYKTKEKCKNVVERGCKDVARMIKYVPDEYNTQGMCNEAVRKLPQSLIYIPACYVRLQEMCLRTTHMLWSQ